MVREFSKRLVKYIADGRYSIEEYMEMEYVLNSIIFESLKFISIFIISIVIHNYSKYYSLITWTLLINVTLMFNKR